MAPRHPPTFYKSLYVVLKNYRGRVCSALVVPMAKISAIGSPTNINNTVERTVVVSLSPTPYTFRFSRYCQVLKIYFSGWTDTRTFQLKIHRNRNNLYFEGHCAFYFMYIQIKFTLFTYILNAKRNATRSLTSNSRSTIGYFFTTWKSNRSLIMMWLIILGSKSHQRAGGHIQKSKKICFLKSDFLVKIS